MGDQKTCIHCGRKIDAVARSCPFCNGDQSTAARRRPAATSATPTPPPKRERRWSGKILGLGAFLALLIAAFAIGSLIHGFDLPFRKDKTGPAPSKAAHVPVAPHPAASDLTLVPVTDTTSTLEASITSAPAPNLNQASSSEYQRSDATALPSDDYARATLKVKAEKQRSASVDPRTIAANPEGSAQGTSTGARRVSDGNNSRQSPISDSPLPESQHEQSNAAKPQPAVRRTDPEPISQPMPTIEVDHPSRATLNLTIGPDGHVKEVEVVQSIPGATDKLIGAVQNWRFKPATENGVPTTGTFQANVSFNPSH
jgi:TonB family protein